MRFKLGKRVTRVTKWIFRRFKTRPGYRRLNPSPARIGNGSTMAKLLTWGRKLTKGAKSLCARNGSGYIPVESEKTPAAVPKGHLAVYVGQKDGEFHRVLVPVVYCNHPLFSDLLREAEREYGFHHPGGITIPCRVTLCSFTRLRTKWNG